MSCEIETLIDEILTKYSKGKGANQIQKILDNTKSLPKVEVEETAPGYRLYSIDDERSKAIVRENDDGTILLDQVETSPSARRKGYSRAVIDKIISDYKDKVITLSAEPKAGISMKDLVKYYESFGFTIDTKIGKEATAMTRKADNSDLGSDEYVDLETEHRKAEAIYNSKKPKLLPVNEIYKDLKADVKYEGNKKLYHQTISEIEITPNSIYVTIGKNRFKLSRANKDTYTLGKNVDKNAKLQTLYINVNPIHEYTSNLGSDEAINSRTKAENLRINAMTKEGMHNIIEELDDGNEGYKKYVHKLIDKIDPKFIPNLKLYINKEAERNVGIVTVDGNIIIDVASDMDKSDKSAMEVYAHEMMHAITKFAINSKDLDTFTIKKELEYLRDEAAKLFTYKDFIPTQYTDEAKAITAAKSRYDYIFKQDNSLHEFLAYGMTNKKVMDKLKAHKSIHPKGKTYNSIFEWLKDKITVLLDIVFGNIKWNNVNKSMKGQLQQLTFELMKHNNEAIREVEKRNTSKIGKLLDFSNKELSDLMNNVSKYLEGKPGEVPKPPRNGTRVQMLLYTFRFLPKLLLREDLRSYRNNAMSALFMKPEGTVQNIVRDIETASDLERTIEQLEADSNTIDRMRELIANEVKSEIKEGFKRKLTKVEEEAITLSAIDTDIGTIYKKYGEDKIVELLRDPEALNTKIRTVTTELKRLDKKHFNWNKNQAKGLGYYMATGKAGYAQNLNAYNIASGILSDERRRADKNVIEKIDELATLRAIKYTPEASNAILSDLIVSESKGIKKTIDIYEGNKKEARSKIFDTPVNIIKGYSKEIYDDSIDVQIKPLKLHDRMTEKGYVLIGKLDKDNSDTTIEAMGIYKSKMYVNNSYNRAAVRMTDMHKRGTSIKDISFMSGDVVSKANIERKLKEIKDIADKEAKAMNEDSYKFSPDQMLSPILNPDGLVVDYRYMIGKDRKKELLQQETEVSEVLGRTVASITDKIDTELQNKAVLEHIISDMNKNYIEGATLGKNNYEYIKIEKNSLNKDVEEIYRLLPQSMKQAIKDSNKGFIAVRRDMLHNYFGFRDKSIIDFFGIHHITPVVVQKWIRVAEKLWMQIVSISKVDIVLKTPAVFIDNVISNFMYSVVNGTNPIRVAKMQLKNMQAVTSYLKKQKEIERLRIRKMSGNTNVSKRITMLEKELTKNPVHDLMVAGMYQAIVEDISRQDRKSSNHLVRKLDEYTKNVPDYIKNGIDWLYLDENTSYFKVMAQATQMSDFVARATEYQLLRERGIAKQEALNTVLDAFVNYSKPASSFEEYLNNMGLIMFTKYAKRVQRAIRKHIKDKPANILLSMLLQETLFSVDDIEDQNIFTRSYANYEQDMWEHVKRAGTPTLLQFAGIVK